VKRQLHVAASLFSG